MQAGIARHPAKKEVHFSACQRASGFWYAGLSSALDEGIVAMAMIQWRTYLPPPLPGSRLESRRVGTNRFKWLKCQESPRRILLYWYIFNKHTWYSGTALARTVLLQALAALISHFKVFEHGRRWPCESATELSLLKSFHCTFFVVAKYSYFLKYGMLAKK